MEESIKKKDLSPLVKSVLALDSHVTSLERLSSRIDEMSLKSEFEINQVRRLLASFAESATGVSAEILNFSHLLNDAKTRSEQASQRVSTKTEMLSLIQQERDSKLAAFQNLTGRVNALNEQVKSLYRPTGEELSDQDKVEVTRQLRDVNSQLLPLIEEAGVIRRDAQKSNMKSLEQNADALGQSLKAVTQKLLLLTE